MTPKLHTTQNTLPSSILHNGGDVRAQYTRAFARRIAGTVSRNLNSFFGRLRSRTTLHNPAIPQG